MFGLSSVEKGQTEAVEAETLEKELLDTNNCYILDCGLEVFVWKGRNTSIDQRKNACEAAEVHYFTCTKPIVFFDEFCSLTVILSLLIFFRNFSVRLNVQNQT